MQLPAVLRQGLPIPRPRPPRDAEPGLGDRRAFEADLARALALAPAEHPLALGLYFLGGVEDVALEHGRQWAEHQVQRASRVLEVIGGCDDDLTGYRVGALSFAMIIQRRTDAFEMAEAIRYRMQRDADPLTCSVGLAALDGERAVDPHTLQVAAEAALDRALLLGQDGAGRSLVAAERDSGLRWIVSGPIS